MVKVKLLLSVESSKISDYYHCYYYNCNYYNYNNYYYCYYHYYNYDHHFDYYFDILSTLESNSEGVH